MMYYVIFNGGKNIPKRQRSSDEKERKQQCSQLILRRLKIKVKKKVSHVISTTLT